MMHTAELLKVFAEYLLFPVTFRIDLRHYFEFFICSGYVREMKPHPDIYRAALEILGTPAAQTVFIDDKEENCAAARALGMNAIRFTSPQQLRFALTAISITL